MNPRLPREALRAIAQTSFRDLVGMLPDGELFSIAFRVVPAKCRRALRRYIRNAGLAFSATNMRKPQTTYKV